MGTGFALQASSFVYNREPLRLEEVDLEQEMRLDSCTRQKSNQYQSQQSIRHANHEVRTGTRECAGSEPDEKITDQIQILRKSRKPPGVLGPLSRRKRSGTIQQ